MGIKKDKITEDIIQSIALKHNRKPEQIKKIVNYQFRRVREIIMTSEIELDRIEKLAYEKKKELEKQINLKSTEEEIIIINKQIQVETKTILDTFIDVIKINALFKVKFNRPHYDNYYKSYKKHILEKTKIESSIQDEPESNIGFLGVDTLQGEVASNY